MTKKSKLLFVLEVVFLLFVISGVFVQTELSEVVYGVGSLNFNISWGTGAANAYLSTAVIGYVFAILYNVSLGEKAKKWTYILAVIGICSFAFEFLKVFFYIPFIFVLRPDLIILIIDGVNFYRLRKR